MVMTIQFWSKSQKRFLNNKKVEICFTEIVTLFKGISRNISVVMLATLKDQCYIFFLFAETVKANSCYMKRKSLFQFILVLEVYQQIRMLETKN